MRIKNLRATMQAQVVDAVLITTWENILYYSGFSGTSAELLITHSDTFLFTDFRYTERAENETDFTVIETKGSERTQAIFDRVKKSGNKIGIDLAGVCVPAYQSYLSFIDRENIVDISEAISAQRCVKDTQEIKMIAKGADYNDKVFTHICKFIRAGVTENDINAEIIYFMNKHGAGLAFEPIVGSGENGSLPHATPSDRVIGSGDFVTMDYGCNFEGYCSDFTRTVAISDIDKEQQKVYDIVRIAGDMAIDALKPGAHAKQIDKIARDYITEMGYGDAFGHGLGHGVGIVVHEAPTLNEQSDAVLQPGMVVTIEPGIYLKGRFGVRIEDLCVITDGGYKNLNTAPRELIIL